MSKNVVPVEGFGLGGHLYDLLEVEMAGRR